LLTQQRECARNSAILRRAADCILYKIAHLLWRALMEHGGK
jgi:hypothetical protein